MVGTAVSHQLTNFIQTMKDEGILDHHFDHVRQLQNAEHPRFVLEVISMFINDTDTTIAEFTRSLNQPVVDYENLIGYVHQIKGSSSSIGGQRMALTCRDLRQACDARDKGRCFASFQRVKNEYTVLRDNLNIIVQMERTIQNNEARGNRP